MDNLEDDLNKHIEAGFNEGPDNDGSEQGEQFKPEEQNAALVQLYNPNSINELVQRRLVSDDPSLISLYDHGFVNGIHDVNKDAFHAYIAARHEVEHYDYQIAVYGERRNILKVKIDELLWMLQEASQVMASAQAALLHAFEKLKVKDEDLRVKMQDLEVLKGRLLKSWPNHTLLTGLFYIGAALLFIFADFIITKTIVANAMDMEGIEATLFAAALAGTSFIFKPMYDRLIEKKYLDGSSKRRFTVFIIVLCLLAIALLAVLGQFRYDAYLAAKETAPSQLLNPFADAPTGLDVNAVTKVLGSVWAQLSIIFSAVLFAVAGGVSMGIGLPVLNDHWQRAHLSRRRRGHEKNMVKAQDSRNDVFAGMVKYQAVIEVQQERVRKAEDLAKLQESLREVEERLIELHEGKRDSLTRCLQSLYSDGHDRGHSLPLSVRTEWMTQPSFRDSGPVDENGSVIYVSDNPRKPNGQWSRMRPFRAIRRIIANDYRQASSRNNGTSNYYDFSKIQD